MVKKSDKNNHSYSQYLTTEKKIKDSPPDTKHT
jgi:hypothetical protein